MHFAPLAAFFVALSLTVMPFAAHADHGGPHTVAESKDAYSFSFVGIDGEPLPLSAYKGKVLLVVNTASQCGFTPQYEGLQALQKTYEAQGFTVVGVPSDNFGGQEFADNKKIKEFCSSTFGITFPMAERGDVKGPNALPFYQWAKTTLGDAKTPKWNFHKYLVGRDGKLIEAYGSRTAPNSPEMRQAIEAALAKKA
jgi:glutathione peroxidase